ncbi:hypothetical protein ITJ44_03170 [Clavibacter sp. VKM Ac-2873]|uniref:hypothetical protein n=1 Tax=Clavibacter sp. VKM Ac-2873 TaxID=2783813 RepID=UPI00188A1BE9|nr:hypothetical protein [Clavibacter sp. VKM Ac-2873]MBF4617078.1 hypothetical protein [Clavibacter sp. VKM Ac-2873]
MSVSVSPTTYPVRPVAAVASAPLPGDPACVAFAGSDDGFRHAGTRSLEVDLAPLLVATGAGAAAAGSPLAA